MAPVDVGLYGKLPSHGDFLRRRVSDDFVARWDVWLQESLVASRASFGDRWLDVYLTSPAWRFACAAGVLGSTAVIGLTVPSVDRVGRYFHLTLVVELPEATNPIVAATRSTAFFEQAEQLVIDTLAGESVDFDAFDARVVKLGESLEAACRATAGFDPGAARGVFDDADARWQLPIGSASELPSTLVTLAGERLAERYFPVVMLWTDGSAVVQPACLITRGLPPHDSFGALLDGSWAQHHWSSAVSPDAITLATVERPLKADSTPVRFRSAGGSDVGCVRTVNQDSRLERTDAGLWAVADGMGGHSDGEVASRMVCDALAELTPGAGIEQMIDVASARLHDVNDYLIRRAAGSPNGAVSGSTVVVLLARDTRSAVLWAGDSRVYRMRGGGLEQLTHDHSLAAEVEGLTTSNVITRAIGGEPSLVLDVRHDVVGVGDRFLLCSDGLTRFVPETQIQKWLQVDSIERAVEGLIEATLLAGAPDNVTAVVVEAY